MNRSNWHGFALGATMGVITVSALAWGLEEETTFHKIIYNIAQGLFAVIGAALAGIFAFKAAATQIKNTNDNIERDKKEKFKAAVTTLPLALKPLQAIAECRAAELAKGKATALGTNWELDEAKILMIKDASLYASDDRGRLLRALLELYFDCEQDWQKLEKHFSLTAVISLGADLHSLEQENAIEKYFSLFIGKSANDPTQHTNILNWTCLQTMCEILLSNCCDCSINQVKHKTIRNLQFLSSNGREGIRASNDCGYNSFISRLENGEATWWPNALRKLGLQ